MRYIGNVIAGSSGIQVIKANVIRKGTICCKIASGREAREVWGRGRVQDWSDVRLIQLCEVRHGRPGESGGEVQTRCVKLLSRK